MTVHVGYGDYDYDSPWPPVARPRYRVASPDGGDVDPISDTLELGQRMKRIMELNTHLQSNSLFDKISVAFFSFNFQAEEFGGLSTLFCSSPPDGQSLLAF